MYNPQTISNTIANSLYHNTEGLKSGRFDKSQRSLQEAESGNTKRGTRSSGRILIGLDDEHNLIILDGRHLLEAHRLLNKDIPEDSIAFESNEAYQLFIENII